MDKACKKNNKKSTALSKKHIKSKKILTSCRQKVLNLLFAKSEGTVTDQQ